MQPIHRDHVLGWAFANNLRSEQTGPEVAPVLDEQRTAAVKHGPRGTRELSDFLCQNASARDGAQIFVHLDAINSLVQHGVPSWLFQRQPPQCRVV